MKSINSTEQAVNKTNLYQIAANAVINNHINILKRLKSFDVFDVNYKPIGDNIYNLGSCAVCKGTIHILQSLIDSGLNIRLDDYQAFTLAVAFGRLEMIELLLKSYTIPLSVIANSLKYPLQKDDTVLVEFLLKDHDDVSGIYIKDQESQIPIFKFALEQGAVKSCEFLLSKNPDVNTTITINSGVKYHMVLAAIVEQANKFDPIARKLILAKKINFSGVAFPKETSIYIDRISEQLKFVDCLSSIKLYFQTAKETVISVPNREVVNESDIKKIASFLQGGYKSKYLKTTDKDSQDYYQPFISQMMVTLKKYYALNWLKIKLVCSKLEEESQVIQSTGFSDLEGGAVELIGEKIFEVEIEQ